MYILIFILVILSAIALWLFQYMNQKRQIRQEELHERKRQQFEELLKLVSEKNPADVGQAVAENEPPSPGDGRSDTTGAINGSESQ